jgi:membrane protease YdiL (CAAX protease family)
MVVAGSLWRGVLQGQSLAQWFPADRWWPDVLLGGAAGALFALLAWRLLDFIPPLKRVETLIVSTLDMPALRYWHTLVFGLLAGVPEEILFRGAMQPALGVVITSVVFGALHGINRAYFLYATLAGAMLGGLSSWRDSLWAPMAMHTLIDVMMLALLIRSWRIHQGSDEVGNADCNAFDGVGCDGFDGVSGDEGVDVGCGEE